MQVALITRDDSLARQCREAVGAMTRAHASLVVAAPEDPTPEAQIYVWDCDAGEPTAAGGEHILLSGREQARALFDRLPAEPVTLVLKPVNPDALRTCLEQAASHSTAQGALRSDRDSILQSLLETTLRLQEYDQDRMNFLARTVHDFRTPLTAVNGYCGLLMSGQLGPLTAAQQEVMERTLHSIRRLSRLATALFQWSSGVRVGLRSEIQQADIEECCRQALYEIRPLAEEKNISVELDLKAPEQILCFDASQMEQLLVNLLENSCKFTPRGGYIKVRGYSAFWERRSELGGAKNVPLERRLQSSRRPNAYRLEVSDTGMGVRPEHLQTIFQEYTSYGGGRDRSGSGLGLAICKRILVEHGGQIVAESGKQGVTFICTLPLASEESAGAWDFDPEVKRLMAETASTERA